MAEHKERMEKLKRIEEAKTLPRINTEDTDLRSGDRVIGASGDRINTEETDLRAREQGLPRINTDETDKDGGLGKILPQPVGGEVYANRGQTSEVHANLG
jgi:hypothetical protein